MAALTASKDLRLSEKDYDWLGPGIYFWENDATRAREWAEKKVERGDYEEAFVLGAIIDLGNCLDLMSRKNMPILEDAYNSLMKKREGSDLPPLENKDAKGDGYKDKLLRFLDCAVIRHVHFIIEEAVSAHGPASPVQPFDTVRGLFTEGGEVYAGARFQTLTHSQIAVKNPKNILGFFMPRD